MKLATPILVVALGAAPVQAQWTNAGPPMPVSLRPRLLGSSDAALHQLTWSGPSQPRTGRGLQGFASIRGTALDASTGELFAAISETLVSLDLDSVQATEIGPIGANLVGLACDPASGTLWGCSSTDLFTLDRSTGLGTQVGPLGTGPLGGLAFEPSTGFLFGTRWDGDLFRVDPSTGQATLVGSTGFFYVDGLSPDVASGGLLGLTSSNTGPTRLISIDPLTGVGTSLATMDASLWSGLALDPANNRVVATTSVELATIELASLQPEPVGTVGALGVEGLALDPVRGSFYGSDVRSGYLLEIDPLDASSVSIGKIGFDSVTGLAHDPSTGTLYGVDRDSGTLLTIDTSSGAGTAVGSLGLQFSTPSALAFDPSRNKLYATAGTSLYAVDPSTGSASLVGSTSAILSGLAHDDATGLLLGVDGPAHELVLVDPETAATTVLGPLGVFGPDALVIDAAGSPFVSTGSQLFELDPATGWGTAVGSLGHSASWAMAHDPLRNVVYSVSLGNSVLFEVDPDTGVSTARSVLDRIVLALAYDRVRGVLFGSAGQDLVRIDPATGKTTIEGFHGASNTTALAHDPFSDTLYAMSGTQLRVFELPEGGEPLKVIEVGPSSGADDMTFDPWRRELLAVRSFQLLEIDPLSGAFTVRGPSPYGPESITWLPPR